jgi:lysozyme family protein
VATSIDEARKEIVATLGVLMQRRADTADAAEKTAITRSIKALNRELDKLEQAELLDAAIGIAAAADAVETAVAAARKGPFDGYLAALDGALRRLGRIGGEMHRLESLPSAEVGEEPIAPPPAPLPPAPGAPPITPSTSFAALAEEYAALYAAAQIRPERQKNVAYYVARLKKFQATYAAVGAELNGIPWVLIGIVHGLESGFDFAGHLHNGDPLSGRTVRVPQGRPTLGTPPFTWPASAVDALMMKGLHQIDAWPLPRVLYELERYNGFGYRRRGLPSPYLWSFTTLYTKGKYVRDHEYDPEAVSKQCGAAAMLKGLEAEGLGLGP